MKWSSALRVPLDNDLTDFLQLLKQHGIGHRVTEDRGEQVLWVGSDAQAEQVLELYQQFQSGQWTHATAEPIPQAASRYHPPGFFEQLRRSPITAAVLIA